MFKIETVLPVGWASERFSAAFYRFLEVQNLDLDHLVSMTSEPLGRLERKTVTLWSAAAAIEFERFLHAFAMTPPPDHANSGALVNAAE